MPGSIYKSREGEAEIQALYDEALGGLGLRYENLTVGTCAGHTHVIAVGPEDAPPVVFLPGGNFLNPTCLRWFSPLADDHRLYAPDLIGQPGRSSQTRPSPKGDGHARWVEDVLDGLGLRRVPLLGLSYGAGIAIRTLGYAPERVSRAALVSPAAVAAGPIPRMLFDVALPMLLYRLRPTRERLLRAAKPILSEPEDLAVRQLGAIYRCVRLDAGLPRMASFGISGGRSPYLPPKRTRSSPPELSSRGRGSSSPTSSTPGACEAAGMYPRGPRSRV
jgi:pimeloyl-ACP methyl ester carboxylesterase